MACLTAPFLMASIDVHGHSPLQAFSDANSWALLLMQDLFAMAEFLVMQCQHGKGRWTDRKAMFVNVH